MFILVLLLGSITAGFAFLINVRSSKSKVNKSILLSDWFTYPASLFFSFLIFYFKHIPVLLVVVGILFIIYGLLLLGLFSVSKKTMYPFALFASLIGSISVLSGLPFVEMWVGSISFLGLYILLSKINLKSTIHEMDEQFVEQFLDLTETIAGIYLFIVGLMIAADRVRILEKIAALLVN